MRGYLGIGFAATALAASCALPTFSRSEPGPPGPGGAGGGAGAHADGGAGGAAAGCTHPFFPPPPAVKDSAGDIAFVGAVHKVYLTKNATGGPLGLDLDQTCTCIDDEMPNCVPNDNSREKKYYCDEKNGIDNAARKLFDSIGVAAGALDVDAFYSDTLAQGNWSLLMRVEDWNGEPNDDQISFSVIVGASFGTVGGSPQWDGSDVFPVSSTSFEQDAQKNPDLSKPKYVDRHGYVTHGWLVASMTETELVLASAESHIPIAFTGGGVMARIDTDSLGRFVLRDGLLTSRLGAKEAFRAIAKYRDENGNGVCKDNPFYNAGKSALCNGLDILKTISAPSSACDALSLAVGFDTDPANIGTVVPPGLDAFKCAQGQDPTDDCCDCPIATPCSPQDYCDGVCSCCPCWGGKTLAKDASGTCECK